jgi:hypothetical protein
MYEMHAEFIANGLIASWVVVLFVALFAYDTEKSKGKFYK